MGKEFFKKIFSIQDYGETHHILYFFGLKLKFPKYEALKKKHENPYYYYKKNNLDITTLPSATGHLRKLQLANLELLKELDYVCKQNNLKYWLDFGTLLGAVRHKGFIPWDDDIDVAMMREDYNKILDAFKTSSRNPDIYADFVKCGDKNSMIIKVQHKKASSLFVDIFPFDYLGKNLNADEQLETNKKVASIRAGLNKKHLHQYSIPEIYSILEETKKEYISEGFVEHSDLVRGLDFNVYFGGWVFSYDDFFPLKEIEYEGCNFPVINNEKKFLERLYGDYMAYPKKIGFGHSQLSGFSDTEKEVIEKLINKGDEKENG